MPGSQVRARTVYSGSCMMVPASCSCLFLLCITAVQAVLPPAMSHKACHSAMCIFSAIFSSHDYSAAMRHANLQ